MRVEWKLILDFSPECVATYILYKTYIYNFYAVLLWLWTQTVKSLLFASNVDLQTFQEGSINSVVYEGSLKDSTTAAEEYWVMFPEGF